MGIRIYRLTSVAVVTSVGQATTQIVARGRIVGVNITAMSVGAAAAGAGRVSSEIALNNNVTGQAEQATGAPPEYLIARNTLANATGSKSETSQFVPLNIPVVPGNFLCINVLQAGGAPQYCLHGYDVYVQE
jgi:hypothetical protein